MIDLSRCTIVKWLLQKIKIYKYIFKMINRSDSCPDFGVNVESLIQSLCVVKHFPIY